MVPPITALVPIRAVIDMQLCWHVIDMRKTCWRRHIKYFMTYINMLFQSNGTLKYPRNKIMSNFPRDTTTVAFCWQSFILRSQCVLYFRICSTVYPCPFFVLWILMNQSFQSLHPEVGMISLLYDSATNKATEGICTKFQVVLYVNMALMTGSFYQYVDMRKKILTTALVPTQKW